MPNSDVEQPASRAAAGADWASATAPTATPTVATKLLVPRAPAQLIERRRLLDVLDAGIAEHVVVLSAPAGSGKTALLCNWVAARQLPGAVGWLSLDRDDNDAAQLLSDLLSALRSSGAIEPGSALDRLTPPAGARTEYFLPLLVNGLLELRAPVVLLLDDVHELTSPQAIATLAFIVRHAPAQCRLVLAGRADPPLPLERLRVRGALSELRAGELAFDRVETAALCARLELTLSEPELEALWQRTEGWAAALRLAAVSLRGHAQPGRFLRDFAGTDRAVADYLVSEVLASVPAEQRDFMLRTSILDSVNPQLADALIGLDGHSARNLRALERAGVPIELIGDANGHRQDSYRYHRLLRELLLLHLRHAHPTVVPLLHRRAAHWYEGQGQTAAAVRHALEGGDWEHAGGLIADSWLELFVSGRSAEMCAAISRLPVEVVERDPRLQAAVAGSQLEDGRVAEAERSLARARGARTEVDGHPGEQLELLLAGVALHTARLRARARDGERHARRLMRLAEACAEDRRDSIRRFALLSWGAARLWSGDHESAAPSLYEALALATESGHEHVALDCLGQLAVVALLRGELTRAEELSSAALRLAAERGVAAGPGVAAALLAAGAGAYARGELEHAEGILSQAAGAAEMAEEPLRIVTGLLQALALSAGGPSSAARAALKLRALRAQLEDRAGMPGYLGEALMLVEARVSAAAGDLEALRVALARAAADMGARPELLCARANLELRGGEPARALATLTAAETAAGALHRATAIELKLLRALAERARGDEQAAASALEAALELAEEEPFLVAFLAREPAVGELLEHQAGRGSAHPALLELLLDGVGEHRRERGTLIEPLTARELKILRYLPTMLSNAEIGAEVFVSLNTVKTHLRSIYRKLGVSGRAEAVEHARRLGLLPSGIKRPRIRRRA